MEEAVEEVGGHGGGGGNWVDFFLFSNGLDVFVFCFSKKKEDEISLKEFVLLAGVWLIPYFGIPWDPFRAEFFGTSCGLS